MKGLDIEYEKLVSDILEQRGSRKVVNFIESLNLPINGKLNLYQFQTQLIKHLYDNWNNKETCILSSRQTGLSTILPLFILEKCLTEHNSYDIIIVSNRLEASYEKIDNILKVCVMNNIEYSNSTKKGIVINGNYIRITPPTKLNTIGLGSNNDKKVIVLIDEYAFIPNNMLSILESHLVAIKPHFIIRASTPNGNNIFKNIYYNSINNFVINWKDIPSRNDSWRNTQIHMLGSISEFEQEYNNKFI